MLKLLKIFKKYIIAEIFKGIRRDGRCEKISQKVKHRNKEKSGPLDNQNIRSMQKV